MPHDVFISHSNKDKLIADGICANLEAAGIRCWIAPRDIGPGEDWPASITTAISESLVMVLVFSASSNASADVSREIILAANANLTIIPFKIEEVKPEPGKQYYLARTHWLEAMNPPTKDQIKKLVERVAMLVPAGETTGIVRPEVDHEQTIREKPRVKPTLTNKKTWVRRSNLWIAILPLLLILAIVFWPKIKEIFASTVAMQASRSPSAESIPGLTPTPQATIIIVTSAEDNGEGTLRQALRDAKSGDTISFDPVAFSPQNPRTISVIDALPVIIKGHLTLDASNAGVILDGSQVAGDWTPAIEIRSSHNIIKGLQIYNFSGPGFYLVEQANFNTIGGERGIGSGPFGEGNVVGNNSDGIIIMGSDNVVTGNMVGTDDSEILKVGNINSGIILQEDANRNTIGPNNIIAYSKMGCGVDFNVARTNDNMVTENVIFGNEFEGICQNMASNGQLENGGGRVNSVPPDFLYSELDAGIVFGHASCSHCQVEIFSTDSEDLKNFEGSTTTDDFGNFSFGNGDPLVGPFLTATSRAKGENTSEISLPTADRSMIQSALDTMDMTEPYYQTNFDSFDLWGADYTWDRIENGKLIVQSDNQHMSAVLDIIKSETFGVEFEFQILDSSPGGHCIYTASNETEGEPFRSLTVGFLVNNQIALGTDRMDLALIPYDLSGTTTVKMLVLGDQTAVSINGQMMIAALNPEGSLLYTRQVLAANGNIICEYDNYRMWDLSGVDFNP
jgi:hypothetical protein